MFWVFVSSRQGAGRALCPSSQRLAKSLQCPRFSPRSLQTLHQIPTVKIKLHSSPLHTSAVRHLASPTLKRSSLTRPLRLQRRWYMTLSIALGLGLTAYYFVTPFRHFVIAIKRCAVLGIAVVLDVIDYKLLFRKTWAGEHDMDSEVGAKAREQRHNDYSATHTRCAKRILKALMINGGVFIKMGQHISSIQLIPLEWSSTMRPLQDQCEPTELDRLADLFKTETGRSLEDTFTEFDPTPIGVASLAQVHRAKDKQGRKVAVKVMHPDLEDFAQVDMKVTSVMLAFVKRVFPAFEFEWLGDEMRENLPLEMDFRHEAANARRCEANFKDLKHTPLVIPKVYFNSKRVLVMEFIEGGRVDDLAYLEQHKINRNQVSQELATVFSKMLYLDGYFHADPHAGNLLIRPRQANSRSQRNFEIALLDHGLYFDLEDSLRIGYARFWLSLIAPATAKTEKQRRKFAKEFAGIDDNLYLIFQSAITGRASTEMSGSARKFSMSDIGELSPEESKYIRQAVVADGIILDIFDILRRIPKRLLMVLKLNDLTRSLDQALQTTHGLRVWLITAEYCSLAAWRDDIEKIKANYFRNGTPFSALWQLLTAYASWKKWQVSLSVATLMSNFGLLRL